MAVKMMMAMMMMMMMRWRRRRRKEGGGRREEEEEEEEEGVEYFEDTTRNNDEQRRRLWRRRELRGESSRGDVDALPSTRRIQPRRREYGDDENFEANPAVAAWQPAEANNRNLALRPSVRP